MGGKTSPVKSFETETRSTGALLTLLLVTVFISPGATSHNPHQPANLTWMIYNPETGEVLNSSSNVAPKGTWWPVLTFDLCVLAADGSGFGPHQLTKFFAHGSFGLFTRNCERKGPQYYEQVPVYVCPEGGRDRNQIKKCGGVDSFYCAAWGCETTGTVHWLTNSDRDLIQVKSPPDSQKCPTKGISSRPGQCFPLQIKFTDKGKKFTRWDVGQAWGLRLYKTGYDTGFRFELRLKLGLLYLAPKVALGPNQGTTPKPPSQNQSQANRSTPGTVGPPNVNMSPLTDPLMKMISSAYLTLNASRPDLTNGCWLCYNIRPPYYEAVAFCSRFNVTSDVSACRWQQQPGSGRLTVGSITGLGTCIGTIPKTYQHLCDNNSVPRTSHPNSTHQWVLPPENGWWACSAGITPCVHKAALNASQDFCVLVHLIPRLNYYSKKELQPRLKPLGQYRVKREPVTALTLAALLGATGTRSGIAALTLQDKQYNQLRAAIDEDIEQLEKSISHLQESLSSLAEVVLQNRRGLNLLFLQQGGLCAALGEECCFYTDHSGVVQKSLQKIREGLAQRKRIREAQQGWFKSWFQHSPWLTTLISTLLGPLIVLILLLTFGPCILNRLVSFIRERLNTIQITILRQQYQSISQSKEKDSST